MSDWANFLFRIGRSLRTIADQASLRTTAFLSVPFLDYASILVASGVLVQRYRNSHEAEPDLASWTPRVGAPVAFPVKLLNGGTELRLKSGIIEHVDDCMKVKILESSGARNIRNVETRWLSAVRILDELPDLGRQRSGSLLARNIDALDLLLGISGSTTLVCQPSRDCLIVDVKKRVQHESKQSIKLSRLGVADNIHSLTFRDLIRLNSEGPRAMADSSCSQISFDAEPDWPTAVIAGSLNFLRTWDYCEAPLRIVLISPSENSYRDAIEYANEIYHQRHDENLVLPVDLLAVKPAVIDLQLMYSD